LAVDFPWLGLDEAALTRLDRVLSPEARTDLRRWLGGLSGLERSLLNADLEDVDDSASAQANALLAARARASASGRQANALEGRLAAAVAQANDAARELRERQRIYTLPSDPHSADQIRVEMHLEEQLRQIRVRMEGRLNPRPTADEQAVFLQLEALQKNYREFRVVGPRVVAVTDMGRRILENINRQVERMREIEAMDAAERLGVVLSRVIEDDERGANKLTAETRARLRQLLEPQNLILLGGLVGGVAVGTAVGAGPAVMALAGLLTKVLFGVSVAEVSEHLAIGLVLTLAARRDEDFIRAADRLRTGLATIASDAATRAAMAGGTVAVGRAVRKVAKVNATAPAKLEDALAQARGQFYSANVDGLRARLARGEKLAEADLDILEAWARSDHTVALRGLENLGSFSNRVRSLLSTQLRADKRTARRAVKAAKDALRAERELAGGAALPPRVRKLSASAWAEKNTYRDVTRARDAAERRSFEAHNRRELRRNLDQADHPGTEAHHIVEVDSQHRSWVQGRELLQKYQIDINSKDNGVLLKSKDPEIAKLLRPEDQGLRLHGGDVHHHETGDQILLRLQAAERRGGRNWEVQRQHILAELERIRHDILHSVRLHE
jgi:hypothetical protein